MTPSSELSSAFKQRSRSILIALFFPVIAMIFNVSVFGVALPTIRDEFGIQADVVAWLAISFSLPFMVMMPLFGRLGDQLGKSRLLTVGIVILGAGTMIVLLADSLVWVFIGRIIQGIGSSGITPLCLAIISHRFPESERGKALGTWNATAPATAIFAPSIGGFLVDSFGWRTIFIPVLFIAILAIVVVRWQIPSLRGKPNWSILRHFDWGGVLFLNGMIIFLVLFLSSRPITGIAPFRDGRLFFGFILFTAVFLVWESRRSEPLINLRLFRNRNFTLASLVSSFRMAMMVGPGFVLALYLADIYQYSASAIGVFVTVHAIGLFLFIRIGGNLADRYSNRNLIVAGLFIQLSAMLYFALLPGNVASFWLYSGIGTHALGAGLGLAAMHRKALDSVDDSRAGAAAGIYSMTRFGGSMLATAVLGIILQAGADSGMRLITTYQLAFAFLALVGLVGAVIGMGIEKRV